MKLREGVWCHNKNDARSGYAGDATNSQTWLVAATARGRGIPGRWAPAGNCSTKLKVLTNMIYLIYWKFTQSHIIHDEIDIIHFLKSGFMKLMTFRSHQLSMGSPSVLVAGFTGLNPLSQAGGMTKVMSCTRPGPSDWQKVPVNPSKSQCNG